MAAAATLIPTGGGAAAAQDTCEAPITDASQHVIEDCDTPARIIDKAVHTVPTPGQLAWQQREVTAFTHFGMNTFTNREWGSGTEDEKLFDPAALDFDQWMRTYKAAGARQVMLTAKHHDGFTLYPSRYTDHDVAASPWWTRGPNGKNPEGDVLGAYVKAARAAGLKVGVYLSPADGAELLPAAKQKAAAFEGAGLGTLPICMAKTHLSLSHDPTLKNAPTGFTVPVRDLRPYTGAGWIVALCGDMMTMPGLGKTPAAFAIDIDESGETVGLF